MCYAGGHAGDGVGFIQAASEVVTATPRFRSDTPGPRGCWRGLGWHQGEGTDVLKSSSLHQKGVTIPGSWERVLEHRRAQMVTNKSPSTCSASALYVYVAAAQHLVLLGKRVFPSNSSSHRGDRHVVPCLFPSSSAFISLLFAWT